MTLSQQEHIQYRTVDLFGGAIQASLPSTFADVSDIRQVPDNQEVYLDQNGFSSITIDILERVDAASDSEALKVHLNDIVEDDDDQGEVKVWRTGDAFCGKMPSGTPAYTLLATCPPDAKQRGRANEPEFVGVLLTLVRLESQATDLVVTINVPHLAGQYGEVDVERGVLGPLMERAVEMRERVLGTLEVREWGLFV